jgi:hypothetical protein
MSLQLLADFLLMVWQLKQVVTVPDMHTLAKFEEILVFLDDAPLAHVGSDFQLEHEGLQVGAVVLDEVLREHHFGRFLEEL